jgi:hypothetical protein
MEVGQVQAHWRALVSSAYPVPQPPRPLASRARILAPVATQPLLPTTSVVLGQNSTSWPPLVPLAHLEALDRFPLGEGPELLALVPPQLLQPSPARAPPMDLGQVQAHRCALVPVAHPVSQPPRPLASRALLLAPVASQPLLPTPSMVLGQSVHQAWQK